jgi:hypothetical protein
MDEGAGIHHRILRSQGGTNEKENLYLECDECHPAEHGIKATSYTI